MKNRVDTNKKISELNLNELQQILIQLTISNDAALPTPKLHKTTAVFQGGGAKGTAYAGAIEAYGDYGLFDDLTQVIGSSAGALTAFLIAIGLDHKQFKAIDKHSEI